MKLLKIYFILAFSMIQFVQLNARPVYNITDFGAIADGKTLNTKSIQKAIDTCAAKGGGQVLIPNGCYLSGTIKLKSNVTLYLEPSAILLGSPEYDDYEWEKYDVEAGARRRSLIHAQNVENVSIEGHGTINGNGGHANFQSDNPFGGIGGGVRPFPISISHSKYVNLRDIKVKDGAFWDIKIDACQYVNIDGISVHSHIVANNDGIDIVDCKNVRISNCDIDAGDDGICLKSNTKKGIDNVVITNCIVRSQSNAIKFGVASKGGFRNVTVSNCAVYDTRLSGIALEMVEGGVMDRIIIDNIVMHNANGSLFIKSGRKKGFEATTFKNIIISNIIADGIGEWKPDKSAGYFKPEKDQRIGITITGQEDCIVENVSISNVHLEFAGGGTENDAKREFIDTKKNGYPEYDNFGITPAYGINCQYVNNIRFSNIVLDYKDSDARPAFYFENSENVCLDRISAKVSKKAPAYIRFKNQRGAFITNSRPMSADIPFCSFEGLVKNISFKGNEFSKIKQVFVTDKQVSPENILID